MGLVFEDGIAFATNFEWAEGDGHFNLVDGPFLPGAAVEPDFAVAVPVVIADLVAGEDDGFEADAMCAVWIGEVTGGVDLVWLKFAE